MKPIEAKAFERKSAEVAVERAAYVPPMIRTVMNRSDWLILGVLALIWGGAFFFIGVAVRHVPPLTYVWLRLTIAAAGDVAVPEVQGPEPRPSAPGVGFDRRPRRAQQCAAIRFVRLGPNAYRQRPRFDSQRDNPYLGRGGGPFPDGRRAHESAQDRRRPARLRRSCDDDRPLAPFQPRDQRARAARLRHGILELRARRGLGPALPAHRSFAVKRHHRPADRGRGDHASGVADRRPSVEAR